MICARHHYESEMIGHGRSLDRLESSGSKIGTWYRGERKDVIYEDIFHVFFLSACLYTILAMDTRHTTSVFGAKMADTTFWLLRNWYSTFYPKYEIFRVDSIHF